MENKFEVRAPSPQNVIDIFRDKWASNIGELIPDVVSGGISGFKQDPRPRVAAKFLGNQPGSFSGMNILELGPLEGAHTYQIVALGADKVVSIESNTEAYMKCLIIKELLQMNKCSFLLGDCLKFLEEENMKFDVIFCSGILYHMEDPFRLLKAISKRSDKVYLWTAYYDANSINSNLFTPKQVVIDSNTFVYYEMNYGNQDYGKFWGASPRKFMVI